MAIHTLCILGTRPEAIKMFPVIRQLEANPLFSNKICLTGQHQQMLTPLLQLFKLHTDFNLNVMTENQNLSQLTAKILVNLTGIFETYKPDLILVHGDTTTAMTAALSAYYHHIPIAHVEAGLRTWDINSPWPEEANRKLVASLTSLHFAPTMNARLNLLQEGISTDLIHVTGNTVIDALHEICMLIETSTHLKHTLEQQFSFLHSSHRMILVTGHRRENFGKGFEQICRAIVEIARQYPNVDIIYPVHLNPQVQHVVHTLLNDISNVFLIEPIEYLAFVYLMKRAYLILTDSGGIQEEAPSLGVPVLVMRNNTERPEGITAGSVKLVGSNTETIVQWVKILLTDKAVYERMHFANNPYGDGCAAERIVNVLQQKFVHLLEKESNLMMD